ncbi:MAG: hypothetical protein K0U68_09190 [Gammaproteobacteria bacterium]|nr:hypothetical protein [Gammaproteobacteria bacterium]
MPSQIQSLVKATDIFSAYVKYQEKIQANNDKSKTALEDIQRQLDAVQTPEVQYFREHFLPALHLSVDELIQ